MEGSQLSNGLRGPLIGSRGPLCSVLIIPCCSFSVGGCVKAPVNWVWVAATSSSPSTTSNQSANGFGEVCAQSPLKGSKSLNREGGHPYPKIQKPTVGLALRASVPVSLQSPLLNDCQESTQKSESHVLVLRPETKAIPETMGRRILTFVYHILYTLYYIPYTKSLLPYSVLYIIFHIGPMSGLHPG